MDAARRGLTHRKRLNVGCPINITACVQAGNHVVQENSIVKARNNERGNYISRRATNLNIHQLIFPHKVKNTSLVIYRIYRSARLEDHFTASRYSDAKCCT